MIDNAGQRRYPRRTAAEGTYPPAERPALPRERRPYASREDPAATSRAPRIAGLRVVMTWPQDSQFAPEPPPRGRGRVRLAGFAGAALIVGGVMAILIAALAQQHEPVPGSSAAGDIGPAGVTGPTLRHSLPVSVAIPEIGVQSKVLRLGRNADGTRQVPDLGTQANEAAWY